MTNIIVAISKVSDGSMYNRNNVIDPAVIHNRLLFLEKNTIDIKKACRAKIDYSRDDFCVYREVNENDMYSGMADDNAIVADGLVTTSIGQALFLPIADCVGVTFFDPIKKVLMLSHLGRHSLEQDGGYASVVFLQNHYGCSPKDILVWLTPAPGKDVYPIWALDNMGMKEATFEQLHRAGVLAGNIHDNPADSTKDPEYYSYSEFLKGNRSEDGDHAMVAMMTR